VASEWGMRKSAGGDRTPQPRAPNLFPIAGFPGASVRGARPAPHAPAARHSSVPAEIPLKTHADGAGFRPREGAGGSAGWGTTQPRVGRNNVREAQALGADTGMTQPASRRALTPSLNARPLPQPSPPQLATPEQGGTIPHKAAP